MSVTNYSLDKCKYTFSKLKNALYLVSADHIKDIHIDNGEAYISGLTELPLRINGFNIQYTEETSLDERYKFDKKITLSMKGYVNYKLFGGKYYAIIEDYEGIYYMVNVDFPSKITHTFNLSQNTNQTDFTFHSLSNFPTIKLNSDFEAEHLPCLGYNVYGIDRLQLMVKDYARLDTNNRTVSTTDSWKNIEFLGKSCAFQEIYDGKNVTDTISFDIPLNHKIGWSWNLLEFLDNKYASIITPIGGENKYFSGFNFGLQPSYSIQSTSNNGESDTITVTLTEMSNYGATAAVDYEEEDYDTTHWRYVKNLGEIICYECVGYARARYLVQQEVDAFNNPTGNYKVKNGYQSQYQMLNVVGTFSDDEQFTETSCGGDSCDLNTSMSDVIVFSSATCNTYTVSASCDWNISGLVNYLSASPISGNANQSYNVSLCNSSTVVGNESTFSINYGNNIKIINVIISDESIIYPTVQNINCLQQDVVFTFNESCPVTVTSIDSRLSYEITNTQLIVSVPANLLTTSEKTWSIVVQDCDRRTVTLRIIQDKVYEEWIDSGFYVCVGGNSYKEEVRYTGATPTNLHITTEKRPGELIEEGDSRCNNRMTKWEWVGNYYCVNGNKQKAIEQFESYDNGITWTKTGLTQLGEVVEYDSSWCDIVPEYDWRLTEKWQCGDGTEYTFEYCDGRKFIMESVDASGGTFNYCITSIAGSEDIQFNVTRICDWVTIVTGASSMTVSVEANTDPTTDRECVVYLHQQISGKQIALNVLQAAGVSTCDRLLDSCCGASQASGSHPDCDIQLGSSGGSENDGVLQNARVRLLTTEFPSWLEVENHDTYVTYRAIEDNTSTSNRYFTVTWEKVSGASTQCETAETIVKQLGGAVPRPYTFRWENGLPYVEINVDAEAGVIDKNVISKYNGSDTSYTASDECDWVGSYSATPTNFKIEYDENTGDTSRSCTVYLTQDGSHAEMRMGINQAASGASGETYIKWGDIYHPSEYSATTTWNGYVNLVPFYSLLNGVETNAVLSTDTNWIITYNQLYYNYNEVKPNRNETIYLNPNTSTSERSGWLTLTQKGGTDYIRVKITQGAYVADCSISSFDIPDNVCIGEPLEYSYTVNDARCDRTFYFNVFDASGNTFTSTSSPVNGRGSGTFDTSTMIAGTAQMSVVVGSTAVSKQIQVSSCGSTFQLIGSDSASTTWNGFISPISFTSKVGDENVNAVMSSNVSWILTDGTYYINQNELRPGINNTVYLSSNSSSNPRTGTLTLTQKGTGRKIYITITQGAYVADCKITSFVFTPGDVCRGTEQVEFNFTVADSACTTQQNFNLFDSEGRMFSVKVTPSGGSGSGAINTSNMALGTASMSVVLNGVATIFDKEIIDCGYVPTSLFEDELTQFNSILSANSITQITSGGTPNTYNYLKTLHEEAVTKFNNSDEDLFKKSTYAEIYDYRTGSTTNHDLGLSAMTSWLMAMQISEIVANSGTSTNNQTKLFQKAYNIGGGRSAPLYGYSDLRSDVSICRLVASAIYGKNKGYYNFSRIDAMRNELGTSVNNRSTNWTELGYSTNGDDHKCDNSLTMSIGYDINFNDIFPAAAGPYATEYNINGNTCTPSNPTAANRQPDSSQPSSQFNSTTKNYKVDETIDNVATSGYNLYSVSTNMNRAIQAVADDSESVVHLFASNVYYKYNTSSPRNSFSAGTPTNNNGSFSGTFDTNVVGKDLSTLLLDGQGNPTAFRTFFSGLRDLGGYSRKTILDKQYGRRRPAQGTTDDSPRCVCGNGVSNGCTSCTDNSCTRQNWLGDASLERLIGTGTRYDSNNNPQRYYIDSNGDGYWENGEPYYGQAASGTTNLCPASGVKAATYPSGHSTGVWTLALFLMQMLPDRWFEIYKSAYSYTISRTIVRAHWNSDIIYGKLCGSAIVPTINSFNDSNNGNFRTMYNAAKTIIDNGSTGDDYPDYTDGTAGNGIKLVLHNKTGKQICFSGKFTMYVKDAGTANVWNKTMPTYICKYDSNANGWPHWNTNPYTLAPDEALTVTLSDPLKSYSGNGTYVTDYTEPLSNYIGKQFVTADSAEWPQGIAAIKLGHAGYVAGDGIHNTNGLIHVKPVAQSACDIVRGRTYHLTIDKARTDHAEWNCG